MSIAFEGRRNPRTREQSVPISNGEHVFPALKFHDTSCLPCARALSTFCMIVNMDRSSPPVAEACS